MASKSSKQALNIWTALPADIRSKILNNVFCGQCRGAVTISDYSVDLDGRDVVLQGFCAACGHKVARLIENP